MVKNVNLSSSFMVTSTTVNLYTHKKWNRLMHALHGNTKLGLMTLNLRGAQTPGDFERLIQECSKWRHKGIHAFAFQEHNLHPTREENLKRICKAREFTLTVSFAPGDQVGETADVHWGGTLILTDDKF